MLISVIITCHNENNLVKNAFDSVSQSIANSKLIFKKDIDINIYADSPNEGTLKSIMALPNVTIVDYGDVSQVRNLAATSSKGEFISFIDADDLMGISFIKEFIENKFFELGGIWHPEYICKFDADQNLLISQQQSSTDSSFNMYTLLYRNLWTINSIAERKIYDEIKFKPGKTSNSNARFAYEDWSWNMDVLAAGYQHHIIKNTYFFIRERLNSNSYLSKLYGFKPHESELFMKKRNNVV